MDESIISPYLIYGWHIAGGLHLLAIILSVLCGFATFILALCSYEDFNKTVKRWLITTSIMFCIGVLGIIFIPTKEIMVEMTITKYVTQNNVEWTIDKVKEVAEYIAGLMK